MPEQETRPDLSLGQPPGNLRKKDTSPRGLLAVLVILNLGVLICVLLLLMRGPGSASPQAGAGGGDPEQLRALAMELEDRSLDSQAARAWRDYVDAAPWADDRAEILYRIGKLYMQAEQYDEAAAALVRCEMAAGDDAALRRKIGPRLVECLRRQGLYGEVGRELARQVEVVTDAPGEARVVATVGGEPITEADVDRMIERRVDQMLAMRGGAAAIDREALLRQLSTSEARGQLLHELLQRRMLCRRARELGIDREDEFFQVRRAVEEDLLAGRMLERELGKVQPTDIDLQPYYEANRERNTQPASIEAVVVPLDAGQDAAEMLQEVESAEDFRKLAGEEPDVRQFVQGQDDPALGPTDALFELAEGEWTAEPHTHGDARFLVLVEKKTPERTPSYNEIKPQVYREYVARKQQELTEQLGRELMQRYEVEIVRVPQAEAETPEDAGEE